MESSGVTGNQCPLNSSQLEFARIILGLVTRVFLQV